MTAKQRALDLAFTYIVGVLYAYALSCACLAGTYLEYSEGALFLWCLFFTALFCAVFFNKYTTAVCLTAVLVSALGIYIYLYVKGFEVDWFIALADYVMELMDFASSSLELQAGYSIVLGRLIALVFSLITALNLQASFHFLVLTFVGLGTIVYPIYMDWGVSRFAIVLYLFCMMVLLAKRMNLTASTLRRRERRLNAGFSLSLLPLCAVIMLIAGILPKPAEAPGGRGVQDFFFRSTNRLVANLTGDSVMSYTSDSEPLGGPVSLSNLLVMEVVSDQRVYLSGVIRDRYTGSAWTKHDATGRTSIGSSDALPAYEYTEEEYNRQVHWMAALGVEFAELEIHMGDFETDAIFSPPFRQYLLMAEPQTIYMDANGVLSVGGLVPARSEYSHSYAAWDWNDEQMIELLRSSVPINALYTTGIDFSPYLQLPDSLPDRVYQLAEELTAGLDNDYDKLVALQAHLRTMPYTLSPGAVPDGVDFVDYFLFEEQQGYCVYFATALAVMGRTLDIPTRYVEGFALPDNADADGRYMVTNAQAHAWVEAYFPAIGWVPFEPTPPGYTSGELVVEAGGDTEIDGFNPDDIEDPDDGTDRDRDKDRENPDEEDPKRPALPGETDGDGNGGAPGASGGWRPSPGLIAVLILLLAAGGLALRIVLVKRRFERLRAEPKSERGAVLSYCGAMMQMGERLDIRPQPGDTPLSFAARIDGTEPFTGPLAGVTEIAELFCKAAFSAEEIDTEERDRVQRYHDLLLQTLTTGLRGRVQYLIHHYVLGTF